MVRELDDHPLLERQALQRHVQPFAARGRGRGLLASSLRLDIEVDRLVRSQGMTMVPLNRAWLRPATMAVR